jgi:uncharacterized protein YidB (DUF937 family)
MDDLSGLMSGLGGGGTGDATVDPATALAGLSSAVADEGGLDTLVGKLRDAGMGDAVDSWIGGGPNQQIDPQRLGAALGDDEVQRLSTKSGLDISALLPLLAAFLPQIINMLTPDGNVPAGGLNGAAQGGLGDLGGMLGGLLGGAGGTGGAGATGGIEDILGGMLGGTKDR